jgi:DNA-binding MarR family transcriptional regulator
MSGRIASEVQENAPEDLTQAELAVLVTLALDARERDRLARFSDVETLVRLTRLKPGTVKNALSELTRRALIKPGAPAYRGRHQEYRITELYPHHRVTTR